MACIERRPRCGTAEAPIVPKPLSDIAAALAWIVGAIGVLGTVLKFIGAIEVVGGVIKIGGVAIASAAGGGALAGLVAGAAALVLVALYALDRCVAGRGLPECVAGVVSAIEGSFDSALDELFPFSAMHDRVDVVAKARYWDVIEHGQAFVHCTHEEPPRRSEIMRCYYYDPRVCEAAQGAVIGGGVGLVAGVLIAAAVAAAIGCATVILCLLALIVAAILAVAAVLIGAFVGGQIGKAAAENASPTAGGETIAVGDYVSAHGEMQRREEDNDANVMWWVDRTTLHGRASDSLPQPFSYCEVDDEFLDDSCARAPIE